MDNSFSDLKKKVTDILEFIDIVKNKTEDEIETLVDESVMETMNELKSHHQEQLEQLRKKHTSEIAKITQEQLNKFDELNEKHAQELIELQNKHETHLDQHKTHLTDFSLVQKLSSQISNLQHELDLAHRKIARFERKNEPEKQTKLKLQLNNDDDKDETTSKSSNSNRVFGKIKLRGVIYLLDKTNDEIEQLIYECIDGKPGKVIGKRTSDGKYRLNRK